MDMPPLILQLNARKNAQRTALSAGFRFATYFDGGSRSDRRAPWRTGQSAGFSSSAQSFLLVTDLPILVDNYERL